ncbi:MAG: glycosyltransferase family 2 protein [Actinomycetota bacterium]
MNHPGPPAGDTPAATVVITNHNYERYLGAAVDSVQSQTTPCQIVVVDDGSTDGSGAVLDRLAADLGERVRVVRRPEAGGQAAAMNTGLAEAVAPIVLFLDADDLLDADAVAEVVAAFAAEPAAAKCQFRLGWIDGDGNPIPGGFPEPERPLPAGDLRARMAVAPDDIPWQPTSGNAFRLEALAPFRPIPEGPYRISADHWLSNLSALAGPVVAIEEELGRYRIHGANADHRSGFDLVRAREILIRTGTTRAALIEYGRSLGVAMPDGPDGFRSLTTAGLRLVSLRAGPVDGTTHPHPEDRRFGLLRSGVTAALARDDLSPAHRLAALGWFVAVAIAPRRLVPTLAAKGLTR